MIETVKKHKDKIVNGSGIAAIIGTLAMSGLQYHENATLKEALFATQASLAVMGERYERLVTECLTRVDRLERRDADTPR